MAGKGIAALRRAGIAVEVGLCGREAALLNEDFFFAIKNNRAFITLKLALTLCGRIADSAGKSQWITGPAARDFAHEIRRRSAAVAVGRGTLVADDPRLTVRHVAGYSPGRIVFISSSNQIPRTSYFARHTRQARSIAVITGAGKQRIIIEKGIEYWYTGKKGAAASLKAFAKMAYENDLTSIMVEGGSRMASAFLEAGLVNRLYIAYGSKIIGRGLEGISFKKGLGIHKCIQLKDIKSMVLDDTVVITGIPTM
jgi:diaminohydroxyphosphoribosylaminopyrimidine deaminase/5-amino-6-(5-phosphoribosylamino)uracil reductase